jgi:hypothetical protein
MAWTSEQDQVFSYLLDSDLPVDTRRSAAAEIQETIRKDATNVPADKLRLAIRRCDIVTEAPKSSRPSLMGVSLLPKLVPPRLSRSSTAFTLV